MTASSLPTLPVARMRPMWRQVALLIFRSCLQFLPMGITPSNFPMDAFIGLLRSMYSSALKIFPRGTLHKSRL